jgi:hypothetical protein
MEALPSGALRAVVALFLVTLGVRGIPRHGASPPPPEVATVRVPCAPADDDAALRRAKVLTLRLELDALDAHVALLEGRLDGASRLEIIDSREFDFDPRYVPCVGNAQDGDCDR